MRDLNPRHPAPKAGALPDCANPRMSHQAVSNEMAHNTDQAGLRQSEIAVKSNFIYNLSGNIVVQIKKTGLFDLYYMGLSVNSKLRLRFKNIPKFFQGKLIVADFFGISVSNCRISQIGDEFVLGR